MWSCYLSWEAALWQFDIRIHTRIHAGVSVISAITKPAVAAMLRLKVSESTHIPVEIPDTLQF